MLVSFLISVKPEYEKQRICLANSNNMIEILKYLKLSSIPLATTI